MAMDESAGRSARLLAAAKKEGSLLLYTSIAAPYLEKLAADFEKRYGIKVIAWRTGNDKVAQRVLAEINGRRYNVDLILTSSLMLEALYRERVLQEVRSFHHKDLIAGAVPRHNGYTAAYVGVWVQVYNTHKVNKQELPKTYQDLLDPKWKNRLGIESQNTYEWFLGVVESMGEEKGLKFFQTLMNKNEVSTRTGHSLLNNLVVSGEVPLALTVYSSMSEQAKHNGAPIDWFTLEPVIANAFAIGLSKKPPHPNAAILFYDYLLSDAQNLLARMDVVPVNKKAESPFKNTPLKLSDSVGALDKFSTWNSLYEEIITKRAK